jgi:hypothetical protein
LVHERDEEAAKQKAGDDQDKLRKLTGDIKVHKYIGETARSIFDRNWEHLHDFETLSTKRHILKHAVDKHQDEELCTLKFGIKVLKYARKKLAAFKRMHKVEKGWKEEDQQNCKEARNTRLKMAERLKKETLANLQQRKKTESWKRLLEE